MTILIGLDIRRAKVYTTFPNDQELMRCISGTYRDYTTFTTAYETKAALIAVANQWLIDNFGTPIQGRPCIFEPDKQGYYIVAHNSNALGLQTINIFFACDENQLTQKERSQLNSQD